MNILIKKEKFTRVTRSIDYTIIVKKTTEVDPFSIEIENPR